KYASKHIVGEQNNYIRLFDAIENQEVYDEKKIKQHFKGETFIRHLPSEKNYLYNLILRSLGEFHSESSSEKQLRDLIHSIELLYDKGLYKQCRKLLGRAKKIAVHYEKPLAQLQLHEWESKILISLAQLDQLETFAEQSKTEQAQLFEQFYNYSQYRRLDEKMYLLAKKFGSPRNKTEHARFERIMRHPLIRNGKNATMFRSKLHFYNIRSYYFDVLGKHKESYRFRKMLIDFAEKQPHLVNDDQHRYVMALNNLLNSQDELGLHEECEITIGKLATLKTKSMNIRARIFGYTWHIRMTQNITSGNFKTLVSNAKEVEDGLKLYSRLLHPEFQLAFKYQFFYGYFGVGDYSNALKWINQLLNDNSAKIRADVYFFGRIMNLILHFELKNTDLLAYNIRNTYRLFIKQKRLFRFETVMLRFIRKSSKYNSPPELRAGFMELKKQLEELQDDPYEKQTLSFFDIISWLESKITKRSFAEIVKEKSIAAAKS
ncbi:MAG TPA: hypothetical protein VFJ43_15420, partial [Bacteroidia bacterium]|nr:hypothetical protein [Bacteroidia bacterium]